MAPITTWPHLEALVDTTVERADLDFKYKPSQQPSPFELAKDVAALANGLGGSIIVGAATTGKVLCFGLPGIPLQDALALADQYERAAGDRCRPRAVLDCAVIRLPMDPARAVLVVNVAASAVAPMGVDLREKGDAESWRFPLRTTSHTAWLSPDRFGGFDDMSARRAGALLAGIPGSEREQLVIRSDRSLRRPRTHSTSGGDSSSRELLGRLQEVDYQGNVAYFQAGEEQGGARFDLRIPLDWVTTVWRDRRLNNWIVITDCVFCRDGTSWNAARYEL